MHLRQIQYHVAFRQEGEQKYHVLPNNINTWVADPFVFKYNDEIYIFGEIWRYDLGKSGRGVIGFCKYKNGRFTKWKEVIREEYHLSFPNIFQIGNDIYICPESGCCGQVYLYKAIDFPYRWKKDKVLYDGGDNLVDTVFFKNNDKLYGFTYCINDHLGNIKNELRLFRIKGDSMDFNFINNPISRDMSISRCGGKVLERNGNYYRVSQNCEGAYGRALVFSKFCIEENYSEEVIQTLYPSDLVIDKRLRVIGTHTFNQNEGFEVIDLRTTDFSPILLFLRLYNRLMRILRFNGK